MYCAQGNAHPHASTMVAIFHIVLALAGLRAHGSGSGSAGNMLVTPRRRLGSNSKVLRGNPADHRAFAGPSPSCMLNHQPCPLPTSWVADIGTAAAAHNWALINSTAMMARASNTVPDTGFMPLHRWGLVSLDNGVGIATWAKHGATHASLEATSAANCLALKQQGRVHRCSIYHNLELVRHVSSWVFAPFLPHLLLLWGNYRPCVCYSLGLTVKCCEWCLN